MEKFTGTATKFITFFSDNFWQLDVCVKYTYSDGIVIHQVLDDNGDDIIDELTDSDFENIIEKLNN